MSQKRSTLGPQQIAQIHEERESARYAQILEALQRMEQGTYGVCAGCDQRIPFERLLVFPEPPRCAACGAGA